LVRSKGVKPGRRIKGFSCRIEIVATLSLKLPRRSENPLSCHSLDLRGPRLATRFPQAASATSAQQAPIIGGLQPHHLADAITDALELHIEYAPQTPRSNTPVNPIPATAGGSGESAATQSDNLIVNRAKKWHSSAVTTILPSPPAPF
jgi:hypothetical protein